MNNANDSHCDCKDLLTDHETWQGILDPAFCNDSGAADSLAHLLFVLKNAIASGPEGSLKAIKTLQEGISMLWPYTEEHKLARELYDKYLSGDLKPRDEPRRLLEDALERFSSSTERPKGARHRRKRQSRSFT